MAQSNFNGLAMKLAGRAAQRVPGLKMLPVVRLIMAAEVLLIGKHHLDRITPEERATMIRLVSKGRGRPRNLSEQEQLELHTIVEKLEPRIFLAEAADHISPVGVPGAVRDRLAGTKKSAAKAATPKPQA